MDISNKKLRQEIGNSCVCFNLRKAARLVTQRYEQAVKSTGLKATQFPVLLAACNEGGTLLIPMARFLGMDRTSLTRNLNVMVAKGLVIIKTGDDKRERRISITPHGLEVLKEALPLWQKVQAEVVETLGPEKWAGLLSGLHAVAKRV